MKSYIDETIAYFTPQKLRALPRSKNTSDRPVFIVGMPRWRTLVEQILASHPEVHGAGELTWMWRIIEDVSQLTGRNGIRLPQSLDAIEASQLDELAGRYLGGLSSLNPAALRICDKLPANFLHLGLISLLFPKALIIHCQRDAMDTCLSCYFSDFASGNLFSFDQKNLGEYYRQYDRLMAHWHSVLDVPILSVQYEHLVGDLGGRSADARVPCMPWEEHASLPPEPPPRQHAQQRAGPPADLSILSRPLATISKTPRTSQGRVQYNSK